MPVRSRGQLLAGMVTLLGLCTAGCHLNDYQQDAFTIRNGGGGSSGAMIEGPLTAPTMTSTNPERRTLFTAWRPKQETVVMAPTVPSDGPAAMMLRPVPAGTVPPSGTVASAWQPVQRVSAEGAVIIEQPVAGPPVRMASSGPMNLRVMPTPLGGPDTGKDEELHPPRDTRIAAAAPPLIPGPVPGPVVGHFGVKGAFPAPGMQIVDAPREFAKRALSAYIIEPPDILRVAVVPGLLPARLQPVAGPHLVRPDGTIGLGVYGDVFVAGLTLDRARWAVAQKVFERVKDKDNKDLTLERFAENVQVDVAVFNSKFYYVITDGAGYGEQVIRVPCTGNETVLDALATIQGLPPQSSKKQIWVARATPDDHANPHILPVDWCGITKRGSAATNYQLFPGDRIYVQSDAWLRGDSWLSKRLAPVERLLGVTLLGSSVVNSIKNGTNNGGGTVR